MIETEQQRRWWFATHPEYSWSRRRENSGDHEEEKEGESIDFSPEDVDAYVDRGLQFLKGAVADLLKSIKRNFGVEGYSPDYSAPLDSGWEVEAGGRIGPRTGPRPGRGARRGIDIRDWIHMSKQERRARESIEAELEQAGANPRDYRLSSYSGQFVAERDNIFDRNQVDPQGRTNVQRMEQGRPPLDGAGNRIILHHANQRNDGPIIELTRAEHGSIRVRREPSQIDRSEFRDFRETYWQARAASIRNREPEPLYFE
jgi:hypothetical protein